MKKLLILLSFCIFSCAGIQSRYHEVMPGESLWAIAQRYSVPLTSLQRHNPRVQPKALVPGHKLYIPFESRPGWDLPQEGLARREPASPPVAYKMEQVRFSWPVRGRISSHFGKRRLFGRYRMHEGLDIAARKGRPVRAARSGHVIYLGNRISGYGKMIILRHADKFSTVYAHLSKYRVKKGQYVARGQILGHVGKTGRATSYHLHFEVRNKERAVNPMLYLNRKIASN